MSLDMSEVKELSRDFGKAPARINSATTKAIKTGAFKIKKGMRRDASGHNYLAELAGTVNYDMLGPFEAEIGFDKKGQGRLANIGAFGSINNAAVFDHTRALHAEVPITVQKIAEAGEDALLGAEK